MTNPAARTVRSAAHAVLRACGMTTIFGNPGSTEMGFFRDWPDEFTYHLALQEAVAVSMADGFAQASGNAAFVNLHSAAGLGNAMGAVFTAYRNKSPLVIMAGQQHRDLFLTQPFLHADHAELLPLPYVKWACEPASPQDVPAAIARGYLLAMQPPRGPVFVSVPLGDWDEPAGAPVPSRRVPAPPLADPDALAGAARALNGARSPVIVVGPAVDVDGGFHAAAELAERLHAPAWASPRSPRASFPEDHPNFAGFLPFTPSGVNAALAGHDLVLVLGAPVFTLHVHDDTPAVPAGANLIQITEDPDEAARALTGTSITGAVGPALRSLVESVDERHAGSTPPPGRRAPARPAPPAEGELMSAPFVMSRLANLLPPEVVIVEEAPSHRNAMHDHLPIRSPGGFYTEASGGLGFSMPAAVGVKLANPKRQVVCIVGDGSSMYSPQAIWSAVSAKAPVVFIVMNNAGYGSMKGFAAAHGISGGPSYDIGHLDPTLLARAQGARAARATTPDELHAAVMDALNASEPTLIDVPLAPEAPTVA